MRHRASLLMAIEGISRPAYRIAVELTQNSRAGLTPRFLSKKLGLPEEEIEYIIDVNHDLFFSDITKVRVVAEGAAAIKRISEGLESRGDAASIFNLVKNLDPYEFRVFEERAGVAQPGPKKQAVEELLRRRYRTPDSVVEYVASCGFSEAAKEVFDIVWQSPEGIMPVSQIRAAYEGSEHEVEQALWELFRGFALFELFRFDAEERLVRVAGLLREIRQWRETSGDTSRKKITLKPHKGEPEFPRRRGLDLSERICRLVADLAARPARLRGDGELFREDRRRLEEVCPEDAEPNLATCLWIAEGVEWIARVDNRLCAANVGKIIELSRIERHKVLYDWLMTTSIDASSRRILKTFADSLKPGAWYSVLDFVRYVMRAAGEQEQPILKNEGGHWRYVSPAAAAGSERGLARALEEALAWLGVVDLANDGEALFRFTELGAYLLEGKFAERIAQTYPKQRGEIIVQPNFDIVVPSIEVDPLLTVPLDQFAIRQTVGAATVYNLSKESFTKAVQEGHDGEAFVEFLIQHNRGGHLPGNVLATLEDWRGSMKRVRFRTLPIIESDDPLVIADLMHRRRFRKHLQNLDPQKMVLYKDIDKNEFIKELEKEGFVIT